MKQNYGIWIVEDVFLLKPQHKTIGMECVYLYYIMDSVDGKLLTLITNGEGKCQDRCGLDVSVLVFTDKQEQIAFENYFDWR